MKTTLSCLSSPELLHHSDTDHSFRPYYYASRAGQAENKSQFQLLIIYLFNFIDKVITHMTLLVYLTQS